MNIDFYNEIRYELNKFNYLIRKKNLKKSDIQDLIIIINNIQELILSKK